MLKSASQEKEDKIAAMKTVYCSGALFNPEEVSAMEEIAGVLERAGYATYLPHRDGVEAFVLNSVNKPLANLLVFRPITRFLSKATFALDIFKILECDCFVFNMNGSVPDEGGVVETGVAFAAGKPTVIYRNDARDMTIDGAPRLLIGASPIADTVDAVQDIPGALEQARERLELVGGARAERYQPPPFVDRMARFGGRVDAVTRRVSALKPTNMMAS